MKHAFVILLALVCAVALISCKQDPEKKETGASYVMSRGEGESEVWYFDSLDQKLFEHYMLQGTVKVPYDNGWWTLESGTLKLNCRGAWYAYGATTDKGLRLDIGGNSFELRGSGNEYSYSDGFTSCTLVMDGSSFNITLMDSWHSEIYEGTWSDFKAIDHVFNAEKKTVEHIGVTMTDNTLEIDGNRFSRM